MRKSIKGSRLWRAAAILALTVLWCGPAAAQAMFGTECQSDFQNGWLPTAPEVWTRCSWFNDALGDLDRLMFYYNLVGAKPWWEDTLDQGELETVALIYANTHGGAWSDRSVWAMWDDHSNAQSTSMRLGDESWKLSILATYACETMKFNDGKLWTRMGPIFRGGLLFAAGSQDQVVDSTTTNETGEDFADDLQHRWAIKDAWADGNSDWSEDQDVAVMATGNGSLADCEARRDGMTWQNYIYYPRYRDADANYYCYWYWENL